MTSLSPQLPHHKPLSSSSSSEHVMNCNYASGTLLSAFHVLAHLYSQQPNERSAIIPTLQMIFKQT